MQLFKNKTKDIAVLFVFVAMFILGTFLDFKISDKLYMQNSFINIFVELIVKLPAYFLGVFSCLGLFNLARGYNKPKNYILTTIYAFGGVICGALMLEDFVSVFIKDDLLKYAVAALIALIIFILLFKFMPRKREDDIKLKKEYFIVIISLAIVVVATFLLKKIVDRTRFEVFLAGGGRIFTNWYEKGLGGDSFPSGHMASIVLLFACVPLLKKLEIFKCKDWVLYLTITIIAIATALSRISYAKHYMSDVAFSGIMAFCVSKIVTWIILGFNEDKFEIGEKSILGKL